MAHLPFSPVGIFRHFTHNQLEGNDYQECSVAFLYLLALLTLRNTIRKIVGFKRPRTREPMTLSLPVKLFQSEKYAVWWESPKVIFFFMAGFYGYSLYKLMRKHQSIKHKVIINKL